MSILKPNLYQIIQEFQFETAKVLTTSILNNIHEDLLKRACLHHLDKEESIRTSLMLTITSLFREPNQTDYKFAASIEALHICSIIHDDVMAKNEIREGKQTVWKLYGRDIAILAGNTLLSLSFSLAGKKAHKIADTYLKICRGKMQDIQYSRKPFETITSPMIREMLDLKSVSLLRRTCIWGLDDNIFRKHIHLLKIMSNYGTSIGFAFNLMDAVIRVRADENSSGLIGKDSTILNRNNPVIIYALNQNPHLSQYMEYSISSSNSKQFREMIDDTGAIEVALVEAEVLISDAIVELQAFSKIEGVNHEYLEYLIELSRYVIDIDD